MAKKKEETPTSGFYKLVDDTIQYAEEYVLELVAERVLKLYASKKDEYTYPINGWQWCESIEEATKLLKQDTE